MRLQRTNWDYISRDSRVGIDGFLVSTIAHMKEKSNSMFWLTGHGDVLGTFYIFNNTGEKGLQTSLVISRLELDELFESFLPLLFFYRMNWKRITSCHRKYISGTQLPLYMILAECFWGKIEV